MNRLIVGLIVFLVGATSATVTSAQSSGSFSAIFPRSRIASGNSQRCTSLHLIHFRYRTHHDSTHSMNPTRKLGIDLQSFHQAKVTLGCPHEHRTDLALLMHASQFLVKTRPIKRESGDLKIR